MYYYSQNSRRHVIHCAECFHIQNVEVSDIDSFETPEEAYAHGYRLCRCCSPLIKRYNAESDALATFAQSHAISCFLCARFIGITTPTSRWRIVPDETGHSLLLYHGNSFETGHDDESPIPGYHLQRVQKDTVYAYLTYIDEHEAYRMTHPLYIKPAKKEPPRKGTRRYRAQQAKAERIARRKAITNVLHLIDSLSAKNQHVSARA